MNQNRLADYVSWDEEKAIFAVERFVKEHGRLPVAKEMLRENGLPSRRTFESKVGVTFYEYAKHHHPELVELNEERHRQRIMDSMRKRSEWTKETLITAVGGFVERHGRLPAIGEYTSENNLPGYLAFCRIAEAALTAHLQEQFHEYITKTPKLKEDMDSAQQDEPSLGVNMTLCQY